MTHHLPTSRAAPEGDAVAVPRHTARPVAGARALATLRDPRNRNATTRIPGRSGSRGRRVFRRQHDSRSRDQPRTLAGEPGRLAPGPPGALAAGTPSASQAPRGMRARAISKAPRRRKNDSTTRLGRFFLGWSSRPRARRARWSRAASLASRDAAPALLRDTTNARGERAMTRTTLRRPRAAGKKSRRWALRSPANLAGGRRRARRDGDVAGRHLFRGRGFGASVRALGRLRRRRGGHRDRAHRRGTADVQDVRRFRKRRREDVDVFFVAPDVTWAYQNLRRVPPGLWRAFHPERLRALDVSHNQRARSPPRWEGSPHESRWIVRATPSRSCPRRRRGVAASRGSSRPATAYDASGMALVAHCAKRLECEDNPTLIDPPQTIVRPRAGSRFWSFRARSRAAQRVETRRRRRRRRVFQSAAERGARLSLPRGDAGDAQMPPRTSDGHVFFRWESGTSSGRKRRSARRRARARETTLAFFPPLTRRASSIDDVPAPGSAARVADSGGDGTRAAACRMRYLTFRPGFFSVFRRISRIDLTDARLVTLPRAARSARTRDARAGRQLFRARRRAEDVKSSDADAARVAGPPRVMCAIPRPEPSAEAQDPSMRARHVSTLPPGAECAALETLRVSSCALRAAPARGSSFFSETDGLKTLASLRTRTQSNGFLRFAPASAQLTNLELLGVRAGKPRRRDGRRRPEGFGRARHRASRLPEDFGRPRRAASRGPAPQLRPSRWTRPTCIAARFETSKLRLLGQPPGAHAVVAGGRPDRRARAPRRDGEARGV